MSGNDDDKFFLLCIDGSENSYRAARYLVKMAAAVSGKVTLLHVVTKDEAVVLGDDLRDPQSGVTGERINEAISILEEGGVEYAVSIQIGDAEEIILDMSRRYEAIVMGYKGINERKVAEMLMGSVADHVLRHTEKPVILVP